MTMGGQVFLLVLLPRLLAEATVHADFRQEVSAARAPIPSKEELQVHAKTHWPK